MKMQRKPQEMQTPLINECEACGMMSFASYQKKQTPVINECEACGMMSFPSHNGVFGAKAKLVVIQSQPSSNTQTQSDDDSDTDDLHHSILNVKPSI